MKTRIIPIILTELVLLSLFLWGQTIVPAQAYGGRTPGGVVAFYYPWYDRSNQASYFDRSKMSSLPSTLYDSGDMNYVKSQMDQARDAGIDAFAVSWNSRSGAWADRLNRMLAMANGGFTLAVHFETDQTDTSTGAVISNLQYIRDTYTNSSHYFHYEGKPVIFFWRQDAAGSTGTWQNIRNQVDPNHEMIWSAEGTDANLLQVFDSIHLFSAAKWDDNPVAKYQQLRNSVSNFQASSGQRKLWTAGVTPGYDDRKLRSPGEFRDREGSNYYQRSWNAAISSNPDLITISSWNEWYEGSAIEPGELWGNQFIDLTKQFSNKYKGTLKEFGEPGILKVWSRTDQPVDNGAVDRTWLWGPLNFDTLREQYNEGPGGTRQVFYFDKSRMEITHPTNDPNSEWFVTNGLLVTEMMRGKIQLADDPNVFSAKEPANVPVAGDYTNNPTSPTFASMSGVASLNNDNRAQDLTNQPVTQTMNSRGEVGDNGSLAGYDVKNAHFENTLGHNIASPFWNFFQQDGPVWENNNLVTGKVLNWVFAMGYPISEAYWCKVKVGGEEKDVLVQAFERRIMTYTPSNKGGFQVEMGNVGKQYHVWRYGQ